MTRVITLVVLALLTQRPATAGILLMNKAKTLVKVEHDVMQTWAKGDRICVVHGKSAGCGKAIKVDDKGAIIKLDGEFAAMEKSDRVMSESMLPKSAKRSTSSTTTTTVTRSGKGGSKLSVALGTNFGLSYLFGALHARYSLKPNIVLGAQLLYSTGASGSLSANAMGGMLTGGYYFDTVQDGLNIQVGAGMLMCSARSTISESGTSLGFFGTLGYRKTITNSISAGLALGGQYYTDPNFLFVDLGFETFRPVALFDLAYHF